jgi:hypothetical protein
MIYFSGIENIDNKLSYIKFNNEFKEVKIIIPKETAELISNNLRFISKQKSVVERGNDLPSE